MTTRKAAAASSRVATIGLPRGHAVAGVPPLCNVGLIPPRREEGSAPFFLWLEVAAESVDRPIEEVVLASLKDDVARIDVKDEVPSIEEDDSSTWNVVRVAESNADVRITLGYENEWIVGAERLPVGRRRGRESHA